MTQKFHYHSAAGPSLFTPAGHCSSFWRFADIHGTTHAVAKIDVRTEKQARIVASMTSRAMSEGRSAGFEAGIEAMRTGLEAGRNA